MHLSFQALVNLQQISDGSLDDVEFPNLPQKIEDNLNDDHDLPTDCLQVDIPDVNGFVKRKKIKKDYICEICNKSFRDTYKLKRHKKVHIKAGELLPDSIDLSKEERTVKEKKIQPENIVKPKGPKKKLECKECNKLFTDSWKLRRHEKVHLKSKFNEETINQNLGEAYDSYLKDFFKYESAIIRENGKVGLKYSCVVCLPVKKMLLTQNNPIRYLGNHMRSIHPQLLAKFDEVTQSLISSNEPILPKMAPFLCPNCQQDFPSYDVLKNHWHNDHKIIAKTETSLLCNLCGKAFLKKYKYTFHMWQEHGIGKPQEHECDICGKKVPGHKSRLDSHKLIHKGTKDHVCHICGAGFLRLKSLRYHTQQVHEHSGKYECMYCDYKTPVVNRLDVHINAVHTKAIKYSCEECNFSCHVKGNLTAHKKTVHLKLKPHKCSICPEAYIRKSELEKHISATGHNIQS